MTSGSASACGHGCSALPRTNPGGVPSDATWRMAALNQPKYEEQATKLAELEAEEWLRRDGEMGLTAYDQYRRTARLLPTTRRREFRRGRPRAPGSNDTQVDEVLDCLAPGAPCGAPASHRLRDCVSTQSRLAAGRCTKDNDIPTLPLRSAAGGDRATRDSGLSLRVAGPRCRPGYPRSTVGACSERSQERRWCPKPRPAVENL